MMGVTRVSLRFDFALRAPLNERVLVLNERVLEGLGVVEIGRVEAFGGVCGLCAVRSNQ